MAVSVESGRPAVGPGEQGQPQQILVPVQKSGGLTPRRLAWKGDDRAAHHMIRGVHQARFLLLHGKQLAHESLSAPGRQFIWRDHVKFVQADRTEKSQRRVLR